MTFSIVALDRSNGDLGVAVASKFLAVGSVVPWARAGVGAIATQALANVSYGPDGLALLKSGVGAEEVLLRLTEADDGRAERQVGIVDARGGAASHTGPGCLSWAGGRTGHGVAVQGNILTGRQVVEAMLTEFEGSSGSLQERLVSALLAGDHAGGDARGRQSAALLIVREGAGYGGKTDRWLDLRVDDHPDPVPELRRTLGVWQVLFERPDPSTLLPIDDELATELRVRLTRAGWAPGRVDAFSEGIRSSLAGVVRIGTPRRPGAGWDDAWDRALLTWMGVANLEERTAAAGWIDPVVLEQLRAASQT